MERNIFTEEHALFRRNVRAWVEKEIIPYKDVWEEANIVPRAYRLGRIDCTLGGRVITIREDSATIQSQENVCYEGVS
jgi:hypothetical protein